MRNDDYSLIWKALSDPIRRQILDLLRERPQTTGELAQAFQVSRFAVMKHLTTLEQSGLITVRKQGRERWNTLNPVPLQLIYERWLRPYEMTWSRALLQLKGFVEGGNAVSDKSAASPLGFVSVNQEYTFEATPEQMFDALTCNIGAWWGHPYVHSETTSIVLEAFVGGRLYEVWGEKNNGVLWAVVSIIKRERELRLVGSMGLPEPSYGVMVFLLEPQADRTLLRFTLEAFGKVNQQTQSSYEAGWKDLLDVRLRAFVERNIRYGIDHKGYRWFEDTIETSVTDREDASIQ